MDEVILLHHPGVRNTSLSFPELEDVSDLCSFRPLLSHFPEVSASKRPYPASLSVWVAAGYLHNPLFQIRELNRFDFNSPCLCKENTISLLFMYLCSKGKDPLPCRAALVPPAATLCSSRAKRALPSDGFDIYCPFYTALGSTQAGVFLLLSFSNNSHLGSWWFLWAGIKCWNSCL